MTKAEKTKRWNEVRQAYFGGLGSLRDLSKKYGVPKSSLERKCRAEGWVQQVANLGGVMRAAAITAAEENGRELALTVAELEYRSLALTKRFLDKIEGKLSKPDVDVEALRALSLVMKETIAAGRVTLKMDEPQESRERIQSVLLGRLLDEVELQRERQLELKASSIDVSPNQADEAVPIELMCPAPADAV